MSRIHKYLPETLKDVIDLKLLNEDLDIELEQLDGYITGIGKEVIVNSASLYGIQKWEKALGITPKDGDSLETRRFRVNNLLTSKLPYTYRWLIKKLTQITGSPSGYTLNINQDDYAITIVLSGLDTNMMIEVQKQLRNAIPSNMVLEIGGPPLVSADIKVGMALRIGTKYVIKSAKTGLPAGKNLFKPLNIRNNGIATTYDKNGVGTIKGTPTSSWANISGSFKYPYPAGNYVLSIDKPKTFNVCIKGTYTDKEIFEFCIPAGSKTKKLTFKKEVYGIYAYINGLEAGVNFNETIKIQLEKGSTATNYEPFIEL